MGRGEFKIFWLRSCSYKQIKTCITDFKILNNVTNLTRLTLDYWLYDRHIVSVSMLHANTPSSVVFCWIAIELAAPFGTLPQEA